MEVKIKLTCEEVENIVQHYFSNNKGVHEPEVKMLKSGEIEVTYEDFDIQEGMM